MKKNTKLLAVLRDYFRSLSWYGFEQKGSSTYCRRGSFTAYSAHALGFEIKINEHDYRKSVFKGEVPENVRWNRALPKGILNWLEVSIIDEQTRYGRRKIIDKMIFAPGTLDYPELQQIFRAIRQVGIFFKPGKSSRLSSEQALTGFCKEMRKARK